MADYPYRPTAQKAIDRLKSEVPKNDLWTNLAEEASELAQAALKMTRIGSEKNPTPVPEGTLLDGVIEEYTDVVNTAERLLELKPDWLIGDAKLLRWIHRIDVRALENKNSEPEHTCDENGCYF